jgi:hypothetical protein
MVQEAPALGAQEAALAGQVTAVMRQVSEVREQVAELLEEMRAMKARVFNSRVRAHNKANLAAGGPLRPLQKEKQPAAGGACAGTLPALNLFPSNRIAAFKVRLATVQQDSCAALESLLHHASHNTCVPPLQLTVFCLPACPARPPACPPAHAALQLTTTQLNQLETFHKEPFLGPDGEPRCWLLSQRLPVPKCLRVLAEPFPPASVHRQARSLPLSRWCAVATRICCSLDFVTM